MRAPTPPIPDRNVDPYGFKASEPIRVLSVEPTQVLAYAGPSTLPASLEKEPPVSIAISNRYQILLGGLGGVLVASIFWKISLNISLPFGEWIALFTIIIWLLFVGVLIASERMQSFGIGLLVSIPASFFVMFAF